MVWTFRQYVTNWEGWPFRDWYNAQDAHIRNNFDAHCDLLRATEDWLDPSIDEFAYLIGPHAPLGEIRFDGHDRNAAGRILKKRRIRAFGFLRLAERDFILFGGGEERMHGTYMPKNADDAALEMYRHFKRGKGELYAWD
jgi:hypothetical protein